MTPKPMHLLLVIILLTAPPAATALIRAEEAAAPQEETPPEQKRPGSDKPPPISGQPSVGRTISRPGITVRENYFFQLPGINLATLTPGQKKRYLERVNAELCTCGCLHDTIARCLVNDRTCSTVRGLAQRVLSEVKAGL